MLAKLFLLMLLVNLLTVLPAQELNNQRSEVRNAEITCAEVTSTSLLRNADDPTCRSYVYCYFSNGSATGLIKSCKEGQYFDDSLKFCTTIKPDVCA